MKQTYITLHTSVQLYAIELRYNVIYNIVEINNIYILK